MQRAFWIQAARGEDGLAAGAVEQAARRKLGGARCHGGLPAAPDRPEPVSAEFLETLLSE
ncbi:MAG: hypothetical protein C0421_15120 [Hyphomonas sp.]|nr:hypothetical protein [Hyphomonas sp.]